MLYPLNLELEGRLCAVVGGGAVAERKVRSLLAAGARVVVIAPEATSFLREAVSLAQLTWISRPYARGDMEELRPLLVFCATDSGEVNEAAASEAREVGALVNAARGPELSDFFVPASIHRGELLVTCSTGGLSPAFSRALREHLEAGLPEGLGEWLGVLSRLRAEVRRRVPSEQRAALWRVALSGEVMGLVSQGEFKRAEAVVTNAIDSFGAQS